MENMMIIQILCGVLLYVFARWPESTYGPIVNFWPFAPASCYGIFVFEWLILGRTGLTWDISTTICPHQMVAVGFNPMTLGFRDMSPTHCAIGADRACDHIVCLNLRTNNSDRY